MSERDKHHDLRRELEQAIHKQTSTTARVLLRMLEVIADEVATGINNQIKRDEALNHTLNLILEKVNAMAFDTSKVKDLGTLLGTVATQVAAITTAVQALPPGAGAADQAQLDADLAPVVAAATALQTGLTGLQAAVAALTPAPADSVPATAGQA